jgi:hypothetical protein
MINGDRSRNFLHYKARRKRRFSQKAGSPAGYEVLGCFQPHLNFVQLAGLAQLLAQQISERIPNSGPQFAAPTVKGEDRADVNWHEVIGTQIISLIINSPIQRKSTK